MQHVLAFAQSALIVRHHFEIDLDDASMEHGVRLELRELEPEPRRGSESAAQRITAGRPLWRADLFDRLTDPPGSFGVAHFHPGFAGNEPRDRVFQPKLSADPFGWLGAQLASGGAAAGYGAWPIDQADAADLACLAGQIVELATSLGPDRCSSAQQCYQLTRDAQESVRLMVRYLRQPALLDRDRVALWWPAGDPWPA